MPSQKRKIGEGLKGLAAGLQSTLQMGMQQKSSDQDAALKGRQLDLEEQKFDMEKGRQDTIDKLSLIQGRVAEKQLELQGEQIKNEKKKMAMDVLGMVVGQDGIDPKRKDAIVENMQKQFDFDVTPFFVPNADEKTGVIKSYGLEDKDTLMKKIDDENADLDRKVEAAKVGVAQMQAAIDLKKLEQGDVTKTAAHAMIEQVYGSEEYKNAKTLEEKTDLLGKAFQKIPTQSTQIKLIEPGAKKAIEEDIYSITSKINDLNNISTNYADTMLTYKGKFKNWTLDKLLKANVEVGAEDEEYVRKAGIFYTSTNRIFTQFVHDMSGAQYSIKEMAVHKDSLFNKDMNPVEFRAVYSQYIADMKKGYRIKNMIINKGFEGNDIGVEINKLYDLNQDPTLSNDNINNRANELFKGYKSSNKEATTKELQILVEEKMRAEGYIL